MVDYENTTPNDQPDSAAPPPEAPVGGIEERATTFFSQWLDDNGYSFPNHKFIAKALADFHISVLGEGGKDVAFRAEQLLEYLGVLDGEQQARIARVLLDGFSAVENEFDVMTDITNRKRKAVRDALSANPMEDNDV